MVNKRVRNAVLGCNLKNDRMISVRFQSKPFSTTVIQVYAPTSNAEEAEVEPIEDLQDLLELTPKKDVLFIIGDWNAKVGSQETPGVTGKFGLGIRNEELRRIVRRDKKAFLHNQYKEIKGNNRKGKTRDLFKKIGDIKRTFHATMGMKKETVRT